MDLTPAQIQRYVRQLLLPEIGVAGQLRLAGTRVECADGGLAAETARDYLARAGLDSPIGDATPTPGTPLRVNARGYAGPQQFALTDGGFAWSIDGSPCLGCLQSWLAKLPLPPVEEQVALAMAAGALAASQLLLAALGRLSGAKPGRGLGFSFFPAASRREVRPRAGCGCGESAGG